MDPLIAFMLIGLPFSALAALAAFLITYEEWSHHFSTNGKPLTYAIRAAIVTFVVFAVLTVLAGIVVTRFVSSG